MAIFNAVHATKAVQWERAKGELRAFVALQGSYNTGDSPPDVKQDETTRWERLANNVEKFIEFVEHNELHR